MPDFQSIFSAIDDRTVESIDFYSGGFPARYGNRMSGVMEIATHGSPHESASEVGLSMYAALANTRGQSDDGGLWWLGSIRRGNLDLLTDRINSRTGNPRYWDAYGSLGQRLNDSTDLTMAPSSAATMWSSTTVPRPPGQTLKIATCGRGSITNTPRQSAASR
ncbi:MAG: hypothetical protein HC809_14030 [Gammaproteobacteria bacterium]|nr:hypothetical protein [Gammaproteobacteria bacterium]